MPAETGVELQFGHSVAPKSVGHKPNKKYRDGEDAPLTLMSDPRVVRGNTQALARKVAAAKTNLTGSGSGTGSSTGAQIFLDQLPRPSYSYNVRGHVEPDLDLLPYLTVKDETLTVKKKEVESQTNEFKERPLSPEYIPRKTGVDFSTEITPSEAAALFDFDREVEPILNVIVYKTLEQALFEVQSEEELLALEAAAKQFRADKAVEMEWRKKREAENVEEKLVQDRLMGVRLAEKREERRVKTVIGAVQAMEQLIPGIFEAAVEKLYVDKVWRRPEVAGVEDLVLAKTKETIKLKLKAYKAAEALIEEMVLDAQALYERAPMWIEPALPRQSEFTVMLVGDADAAAEDGESAVPKPKALGPINVYDHISVKHVYAELKELAAAKGVTLDLSLPTLHKYFNAVVGRDIALDGAIMNFGDAVPDSMVLTIG